MKEPSIKKNIALNTVYQVLTVLIPFITAPYISRVIGDERIGIYSYTHANMMYFSIAAALGTMSYGGREIARARDSAYERSKLFWEIEILSCITSAIGLAAYGIFIWKVQKYKAYYLVMSFAIAHTMADVSWFFSGLEQFKYMIRQNTIFKLLGVVLMFLFVKKPEDMLLYVAIVTITGFLGTLTMWIYLPKFLVRVPLKELRVFRHLKKTLTYFLPTIATSIYTILDKTLIGVITKDAYENGYYEQATKVVNIIKSLTFASVNSVIGARVAYLFKQEAFDEIHRRINESVDFILFMGFGYCLGIIGVAPSFIPIYFGPGYDPVIGYLQLLSPVVIIIGISSCLGAQYYNPAGLRAKSAVYLIIGSCVNLVMNILLIPHFKGMGAIIGTLAAEGTISALYLHFSAGYLTWKQLWSLTWKKLLAGLIMLAAVIGIWKLLGSGILSLLVQIACGAAVYVALLFLMKDSSMEYVKNMAVRFLKRKAN